MHEWDGTGKSETGCNKKPLDMTNKMCYNGYNERKVHQMKYEIEIIKSNSSRCTVQYDYLYQTPVTVYAYVGSVLADTFSATRMRKRDDRSFAYYAI